MKYLLMIVFLAGAAWHWHDHNTLSEREIVALYKAQGEAWQTQDAAALCEQIADDFHGTVRAVYGTRVETDDTDKESACAGAQAILGIKAEADKNLPEDQQLGWNYRFDIKSITISADKKTAEVDIAMHMNIGNLFIIDSEGTDTVALRNGKPVFAGGDASARYSGVFGDAMTAALR